MSYKYNEEVVSNLINKAQEQNGRKTTFSKELSAVQQELRERRKSLLGSYISARTLVRMRPLSAKDNIEELSRYLATRTIPFWNIFSDNAETFSFRFYRLALSAITSGRVGHESIDDILQLADCLVRNRRAFIIAMKELLPADMIGELYDFAESYGEVLYSVSFENAVLGGLCVFLGVLEDPVADSLETE